MLMADRAAPQAQEVVLGEVLCFGHNDLCRCPVMKALRIAEGGMKCSRTYQEHEAARTSADFAHDAPTNATSASTTARRRDEGGDGVEIPPDLSDACQGTDVTHLYRTHPYCRNSNEKTN